MEERIMAILKGIKPSIDYSCTTGLFSNRLFDSLEFVLITSALEEEFGVSFSFDDMDPQNFDTVEMIKKTIENMAGEP